MAGRLSPERKMAAWIKYIDAIHWAPGELNHQEFAAFAKAAYHAIDPDIAFNFIVDRMKRCGARDLRLSKIRYSLLRAYGTGGEGPCRSAPPLQLPPVEPYSEQRLRETVGDLAEKVDEAFFIERSPFTTWNRTPAGVLHKLCVPGEKVWVTANDASSDGCLWSNDGINGCSAHWISASGEPGGPERFESNFACLSFFARNQRNVWFLNNPVTGNPHFDARLAHGQSYRSRPGDISSWRQTSQLLSSGWHSWQWLRSESRRSTIAAAAGITPWFESMPAPNLRPMIFASFTSGNTARSVPAKARCPLSD
jgi:hypothetical protein